MCSPFDLYDHVVPKMVPNLVCFQTCVLTIVGPLAKPAGGGKFSTRTKTSEGYD